MTNKYESYKKIDIDFLNYIPKNWGVNRLKNVVIKKIDNRGKTAPVSTFGIPMLEIPQITRGKKHPTKDYKNYVDPNIIHLYERDKIKENDILITTVGATSGKNVIVGKNPNFFINQNVVGLRVGEEYYGLYIWYLINSTFFKYQLMKDNKGNTIDNLKVSTFITNKIINPKLTEQKLIANYLDEKTSSIDNSIETLKLQKERLIEQKKAIIHKAVTKGLDDSVEMKDSGVEWIGEIPKHWKIEHLKNLINYKTGNTPDSKKSSYYGNENDYPWANISDLNNKNIYSTKKTLTKEGVIAKNLSIVKENSLLFSFKLSVGNCSFNRIPLYTNEAIASFEENKKVSLNWLYYFMSYFFINNSKENIYGAPILNRDLIENGSILKIAKKEQVEIAEYLNEKTLKIEEAVNEVEKQISLLEEYKKTLINDVVTGKIKVF